MTTEVFPGTRYLRAGARRLRGAVTWSRARSAVIGELWRRSLQVRVAVSTLALSSAVVFVLGMVLQNQITTRQLDTKREAAVGETLAAAKIVEKDFVGVNWTNDLVSSRLASAQTKLTSAWPDKQTGAGSAAGPFEAVLAYDSPDLPQLQAASAGTYTDVPLDLRITVQSGKPANQIHTVDRGGSATTFLIVGAPVNSGNRPLQVYLLFPLAAEQNTISLVQNTILVGGLVLLALLAAITSLVTRQVVLPVRRAAQAAERFADGALDERLPVIGEDDVARLAESYNQMAESIQEQIHQLEEFGQLQRRFTSDVSHELRTPLTTVRMAADVLHASRAQFPSGLARSTELLVAELDRFESLLADLLEISRLDAGVEELVADPVDVRIVVRRAVESVQVIADNAGTEIELDLPPRPAEVEIDSRRVERILRNLLANAVDHGERKPVTVAVAAGEKAVAISVRDRGVGLRPGEAELVFNRFWRADPSRNRYTGGTGLGLAISVEDARLHGGILEAWGEPGKGALFRLTLPVRQDPQAPELTDEDSPLPLQPPAEPERAQVPAAAEEMS